jgi:hypothetical protein
MEEGYKKDASKNQHTSKKDRHEEASPGLSTKAAEAMFAPGVVQL